LSLAAQAGAADNSADRQVGESAGACRYQGIGGTGPLEDGGDTEARRHFGRNVLHRMHGDVCFPGLHCDLEFLDEQALAADLLQTLVEDLITASRQRHQRDVCYLRQLIEFACNVFGLPQCKLAFARRDSDFQAIYPFFRRRLTFVR
jgi:hypothetical protein